MQPPSRIYFDHNATTPLRPEVWAAMSAVALGRAGNPSSLHTEGREARHAIETARAEVAALLRAQPSEVVFTSGGTEANATAVLGAARAMARRRGRPGQVVVSPLEHPSVRRPVQALAAEGHAVVFLPVDAQGRIDPDPEVLRQLLAAAPTDLVSVALCNHEIGNLYPVAELCRLAHEAGALFHTDAVQAVGRVPVDFRALDADLLTASAHKLYGPKGAGALVVKAALPGGVELAPLLTGGQQEKGRRAGTENVLGIVGFGRACALAREELAAASTETAAVAALRDDLERRLLAIPGARRHGSGDPGGRAPGTANIGFAGVPGELVLMNLDLRGAAVSTGAACSSGSPEPSAVLLALGLSREEASEAVRFSLGRGNTAAEVAQVAAWVHESVAHIRALGPPR